MVARAVAVLLVFLLLLIWSAFCRRGLFERQAEENPAPPAPVPVEAVDGTDFLDDAAGKTASA
ncbi:MAG: hypothetical protein ACREMY_08190 [bacterium]